MTSKAQDFAKADMAARDDSLLVVNRAIHNSYQHRKEDEPEYPETIRVELDSGNVGELALSELKNVAKGAGTEKSSIDNTCQSPAARYDRTPFLSMR